MRRVVLVRRLKQAAGAGFRVLQLALGLPVFLAFLSPVIVLGFVVFVAGAGGARIPLSIGAIETLLVALGVTIAMSALCFNYSRASQEGGVEHRVGYLAGRLLLYSAVLLITAGTVDFLALNPVVPENAPAHTPVTSAIAALVLQSARSISYSGAVALAAVAVMRLYWHALAMYFRYVSDPPNKASRS